MDSPPIWRNKKKNPKTTTFKKQNSAPIGHVKQKSALEHARNAQIQNILCMHKVSSGPLLSIHTFCCIQWFC